jgi:hypothetical protein
MLEARSRSRLRQHLRQVVTKVSTIKWAKVA